jgi:uncharacterized protein YfbU (UPF0304 family)
MIKKPFEIGEVKKKYRMLIAGFPGIGKTTVALSAPKPLLIDVDKGIDRVRVNERKDFSQPLNYEELLQDLNSDLSEYETLVLDTGGKLLDLMKPYVIKQDSKNGQKDGQTLSIKGYGAVGKEFARLTDYIAYTLNKHVIIIFHAKEDKDGEATKLRILVEGSTKDNVWQPMDLGGFIEMYNGKRTIGFDNCERYYAKGTHGIKGIREIPDLENPNNKNDFLTKLFEEMDNNTINEAKFYEEDKKEYEKVMNEIKTQIDSMTEDNVMEILAVIKNTKHYLTSQKELQHIFKQKCEELGLVWSSSDKKYLKKEITATEAANE